MILVGSGGIWWDLVGSGGIWWDLVGSGGIWWNVVVGSFDSTSHQIPESGGIWWNLVESVLIPPLPTCGIL
jgi:hypothetical protein